VPWIGAAAFEEDLVAGLERAGAPKVVAGSTLDA